MTRSEEQTRALFDEWAASYDVDLLHERGPLMGYKHSLSVIDDVVPVESESLILDIGIGSGAIARRLEDRGAKIMGIDISEKMLAVCKEQNPTFDLRLGTFNSIPTSDEVFTGVVSGFAFHETPISKRHDACREMARVLKPGGYLCLLDIMFASPTAMQEAQMLIAHEWDNSEDYALVQDLDTLIRDSGFTSVKWYQTAPFHWILTARK
jgi:ubiquinone/menaquinone biosynthesis C-methylase UbiE